MLKILLIDDEPDSVKSVIDELQANLPDTACYLADFENAATQIASTQPDVVVLDLMKKTPEGGLVNEGDAIGLDVWKHRFCPLIFYTASVEDPDEYKHPLVSVVRKGSQSEEEVRNKVMTYLPHIAALGKVANEINSALRRALQESKPHVFKIELAEQENQLLTRSIRRRVAASMDEAMAIGEPNLKSWEQYLCPPSIPDHLLTGDILRVAGSNKDDPASYRVVLTPSCDLVRSTTRAPKVEGVLVARCVRADRILADLGLSLDATTAPKKVESAQEKISKFLTQGYGQSSFPVAGLPGEFPEMAADFRSLETIPVVELEQPTKYDRVASVDAPFRELFVWAYLSAAGRPAMPDRDFDTWAKAIIEEVLRSAPATEVPK